MAQVLSLDPFFSISECNKSLVPLWLLVIIAVSVLPGYPTWLPAAGTRGSRDPP